MYTSLEPGILQNKLKILQVCQQIKQKEGNTILHETAKKHPLILDNPRFSEEINPNLNLNLFLQKDSEGKTVIEYFIEKGIKYKHTNQDKLELPYFQKGLNLILNDPEIGAKCINLLLQKNWKIEIPFQLITNNSILERTLTEVTKVEHTPKPIEKQIKIDQLIKAQITINKLNQNSELKKAELEEILTWEKINHPTKENNLNLYLIENTNLSKIPADILAIISVQHFQDEFEHKKLNAAIVKLNKITELTEEQKKLIFTYEQMRQPYEKPLFFDIIQHNQLRLFKNHPDFTSLLTTIHDNGHNYGMHLAIKNPQACQELTKTEFLTPHPFTTMNWLYVIISHPKEYQKNLSPDQITELLPHIIECAKKSQNEPKVEPIKNESIAELIKIGTLHKLHNKKPQQR
jgi:hypothetical protein